MPQLGGGADGRVLGVRTPYATQREPDRGRAPQGLYRCRGFEQWLAVTIVADADWEALKEVMGSPAWAEDPAFGDLEGRRAGHDTIDRELGAWAAGQDLAQVVESLVARGVAAGA